MEILNHIKKIKNEKVWEDANLSDEYNQIYSELYETLEWEYNSGNNFPRILEYIDKAHKIGERDLKKVPRENYIKSAAHILMLEDQTVLFCERILEKIYGFSEEGVNYKREIYNYTTDIKELDKIAERSIKIVKSSIKKDIKYYQHLLKKANLEDTKSNIVEHLSELRTALNNIKTLQEIAKSDKKINLDDIRIFYLIRSSINLCDHKYADYVLLMDVIRDRKGKIRGDKK
ncbi:MAG: hypothetical protein J7K26_03000 [Candidatus Aenigmarchaeota archaeon]|nr:hypothetical protein [Candidatus Aenigmarchaeota archaeon]